MSTNACKSQLTASARTWMRLTNAFSKKLENHAAMVAMLDAEYEAVRPKTRGPYRKQNSN